MFRFFVDKRYDDNHFELSDSILRHIKVARVSDEYFICTYKKRFYKCSLEGKLAKIIEPIKKDNEFQGEVIVAISIIKTKRFEWMIQKAAELGCSKIIPLISKNVVQKLGNDIDKKILRWNEISKNACEQSFRNQIMEVSLPMDFNEVLSLKMKHKYIAHEKHEDHNIGTFPVDSLFLIGPEGGFTNEEVTMANKCNFKTISLGKRILRAETAPLFILSRIN